MLYLCLTIILILAIIGVHVKSLQSCQTLCDPIDYSPASFSIHGILQARILEWVAISSSKGSSWPRGWTQVSCVGGRVFTIEPPWKPPNWPYHLFSLPLFPLSFSWYWFNGKPLLFIQLSKRDLFLLSLCSCTFNQFPSFIDSPFLKSQKATSNSV